jgi:hypothetical protein
LTLIAAVTFIVGYITRWRHFAIAMTCIYVTMAAVCALETFKYMTSSLRYVAMVLEYLAYATILLFLYRSDSFGKRLR